MSRETLPFGAQMSLREIAEELDMTVGAVHMHLSRGLKKLRSQGLVIKMQELANELDRNRNGSVEWN
jgi:DNA-directed RNA polymerase specialized sigma24 family protein